MEADTVDGGGKGGLGILMTDKFLGAARLGHSYQLFSVIYPKKSRQKIEENNIITEVVDSEYQSSLKEKVFSSVIDTKWYPFKTEVYSNKLNTDKAKNYLVKLSSTEDINKWLDGMEVYNHRDMGQELFVSYALAKTTARFLKEKNITPRAIELNESDTAVAIPVFKEEKLKTKLVGVSHTPEKWGHKCYPVEDCKMLFNNEAMKMLRWGEEDSCGQKKINFGRVLAHYSDKIACVSKSHEAFSKENIYPEYAEKTVGITNGIDIGWISPRLRELYDEHVPGWSVNPKLLEEGIENNVPKEMFLEALRLNKRESNDAIESWKAESRIISNFDKVPDKPKIIFAKRFVPYKNVDKVLGLVNSYQDAAFFFAGPPIGPWGNYIVNEIKRTMDNSKTPVAYIINYNREKSRKMVLDGIWMNIPDDNKESSATAFMKVGNNGRQVATKICGSVGDIKIEDGVNAFIIKDDLSNMSQKLDEAISVGKDNEKSGYAAMKTAASFSHFLMPRMLDDYEKNLYG
jgi:glucan phosphorylase